MKTYSIVVGIVTSLLVVATIFLTTPTEDIVTPALGATVVYPHQGGTGASTTPNAGDLLMGISSSQYATTSLVAGSNVTIATSTDSPYSITISSSAAGGSGVPDWLQETYNGANVLTPTTTIEILVKDTASSTFLGPVRADYSGARIAEFGTLFATTSARINTLTLDTALVVASGGTGATTLTDLITLTTHTTGNYTATIADAGNSTITVVNGSAEGGAVTLDAIDLNCTDCINATEIEDIYVLTA